MTIASAVACPNIAFIKYWGNRDDRLRIPASGSISMNLGSLSTSTTVSYSRELAQDQLSLNGIQESTPGAERVSIFLDTVRRMAGINQFARVESQNNFPTGTGIASSASAFAALALAASCAAGLHLTEIELSRLARTGSGSACRSIPPGYVEWLAGTGDQDSYAVSIASPEHWDLVDCVAVVSKSPKSTGSTEGHRLANTSPLQEARIADAPRRLDICKQAIINRDFSRLAEIAELDSNLMHAVMSTSNPALIYYSPTTLLVIHNVISWRKSGLPVFYTIDAGPNVHVITLASTSSKVEEGLRSMPGVEAVLISGPGGGVQLQ